VTITYTATSALGCAGIATTNFTVTDTTALAAITGTTSVCAGVSSMLANSTAGGTWSSSNPSVATINTGGAVTGVATGSATIVYHYTSSLGCSSTTSTTVTVNAVPTGTLTPTGSSVTLCHGNPVAMSVSSTTATSYQWLLGGSPVTGATTNSYNATAAGTYSVRIANGGCNAVISSVTVIPAPNPVIMRGAGNLLYTGTSFTTYQWYVNSTAIAGATTYSINATASGLYKVLVTDGNGCSQASDGFAVGTNGIAGVTMEGISIFPNPATSQITIAAPVRVNVSILSADGKLVISQQDATNIDVSNLASGMYLIMIYSQDNELLKADKFIKAD
jgi:hypothetical protein